MSEQQKILYEMSRNYCKGGGQKLTTHGQSYEECEEERRQQVMKHDYMLSTIVHAVTRLKRDTELACEKFYLVHMNYLCRTGDGVYYPAEIALSAFSIKDGMRVPYHSLVNPGPLPTGYALKARQHSEDTHRIDPVAELGAHDVAALVAAVESYVERWGSSDPEAMPPLYTLEKFVPSVREMLTRWAIECDKPEGFFRVFELEELLYQLKLASLLPPSGHSYWSSLVAGKKLQDDPHCFRPKIACQARPQCRHRVKPRLPSRPGLSAGTGSNLGSFLQLHEDLDAVEHCSRSIVIRWGWVLCDQLCDDHRVQRVPGLHCPYLNATPIRQVMMPSRFGCRPSFPLRKPLGRGAKPKTVGRGITLDTPRNLVWAPVPKGSRGCSGPSRTGVSPGTTGAGDDQSNAAGPSTAGSCTAVPGLPGPKTTCSDLAFVVNEVPAPEEDQFEDAHFFPGLTRMRHRISEKYRQDGGQSVNRMALGDR